MSLEDYQKQAMQSLSPELIDHHPDYVGLPHPVRNEKQQITPIWTYVTCLVCHNHWHRDNPNRPSFRAMVFKRKKR